MNSLVIILIAVVVLGAGYLGYGRWLAKKWGVDPNAKTPAVANEDGKDYVPSSKLTVFAHQFSSIAGAGPVQGPIIAAMFGWVPVLLWLLVGGVFFGAVQDFGALYASVKNGGRRCPLWRRLRSPPRCSARPRRGPFRWRSPCRVPPLKWTTPAR